MKITSIKEEPNEDQMWTCLDILSYTSLDVLYHSEYPNMKILKTFILRNQNFFYEEEQYLYKISI